ncbi:hypothetical protein ABPG75_004789 [Micractinium tetrahymenae]
MLHVSFLSSLTARRCSSAHPLGGCSVGGRPLKLSALSKLTRLPFRERITIDRTSWKIERQLAMPGRGATKWREGDLVRRQESGAPQARMRGVKSGGIVVRRRWGGDWLAQPQPPNGLAQPNLN